MYVLNTSVRHILDVVRQSVLRLDLQQTVLEALVGEILRILRIHYADAIDNEAIGVHVRRGRTESHCPDTIGITLHLLTSSKLDIHQHTLCRVVLIVKGHGSIWITDG